MGMDNFMYNSREGMGLGRLLNSWLTNYIGRGQDKRAAQKYAGQQYDEATKKKAAYEAYGSSLKPQDESRLLGQQLGEDNSINQLAVFAQKRAEAEKSQPLTREAAKQAKMDRRRSVAEWAMNDPTMRDIGIALNLSNQGMDWNRAKAASAMHRKNEREQQLKQYAQTIGALQAAGQHAQAAGLMFPYLAAQGAKASDLINMYKGSLPNYSMHDTDLGGGVVSSLFSNNGLGGGSTRYLQKSVSPDGLLRTKTAIMLKNMSEGGGGEGDAKKVIGSINGKVQEIVNAADSWNAGKMLEALDKAKVWRAEHAADLSKDAASRLDYTLFILGAKYKYLDGDKEEAYKLLADKDGELIEGAADFFTKKEVDEILLHLPAPKKRKEEKYAKDYERETEAARQKLMELVKDYNFDDGYVQA